MKRTNVMVDETLLEEARRALGEKTYSGAIARALEGVVRRQRLEEAVAKVRGGGDPFRRGYVEEAWPESAAVVKKKSLRASADERRAPRKRSRRAR